MTPTQASTQLLVHFDEASAAFTDVSVMRRAILQPAGGNFEATLDAKFGVRALRRPTDGWATPYKVTIPFDGRQPFWMEAWVYPEATTSGNGWVLGTNVGVAFGITSSGSGSRWFGTVWDTGNSGSAILSPAAAPIGAYAHLLFGQDEGLNRRLFVNGVQVASAGPLVNSKQAYEPEFGIGGNPVGGEGAPRARIDELRYVLGLPCPTADFTPPAAPYDDIPRSLLSAKVGATPLGLVASAQPAVNWSTLPQPRFLLDRHDGGFGQITGVVEEKALPTDRPLARRVRLFHEVSGRFIRETWSNASGAYAFTGIDPTQRYTVVAYDHLGNHRAVIADNILPEAMP